MFVVEKHQGKGLGKWLMKQLMKDPQLQGLRHMLLATRDAHGLYEQLGFRSLSRPDTIMELWNPDIYLEST